MLKVTIYIARKLRLLHPYIINKSLDICGDNNNLKNDFDPVAEGRTTCPSS